MLPPSADLIIPVKSAPCRHRRRFNLCKVVMLPTILLQGPVRNCRTCIPNSSTALFTASSGCTPIIPQEKGLSSVVITTCIDTYASDPQNHSASQSTHRHIKFCDVFLHGFIKGFLSDQAKRESILENSSVNQPNLDRPSQRTHAAHHTCVICLRATIVARSLSEL